MRPRLGAQLEGALQAAVAALVVSVAFVASHIQPWNFPEVRIVRTFAVLELGAIAVAWLVAARARPRLVPGAGPVAAFAALALLSAAWSVQPSVTLERALGFAALLAAAAAVGLAAARRERVAEHVIVAMLAAVVLVALAGLVELWHSYDQAVLAATRGQGARYNGIGQNPNQVAMLIAVVLPFALWVVRLASGRARLVWLAALLLLAGSLVASGSRGAVIGAAAGSLVYLLAVVPGRRLLVAGAVGAAFVAAIGATQLPQPAETDPPLYEAFGRTPVLSPHDLNSELPLESEYGFPGENAETGATRTLFFSSGRVDAWRLALEQGLERPVAGYGFGTEDETFVDRSYLFVSQAVENSFVGTFLELGAVGLALLLAALAVPLAAWARSLPALRGEGAEHAAACAGAVVAGVASAVPQSFLTAAGSPPTAPFWIAYFLLAGLIAGAAARRRASAPADRARRASASRPSAP